VQTPPGRICGILEWDVIILINAPVRTRTRDLWLWYYIELHAPTSSPQKFKLMRKGGQFTCTLTLMSDIARCTCIIAIWMQAPSSKQIKLGSVKCHIKRGWMKHLRWRSTNRWSGSDRRRPFRSWCCTKIVRCQETNGPGLIGRLGTPIRVKIESLLRGQGILSL
jgi:hypothetical protein